jgi:hypothetical protein
MKKIIKLKPKKLKNMPKVEIEVSESELRNLKGDQCTGPIKIAILQRGWVFVGRFSKNGSDCKLENASCIRQWGTTKGLGELANGPTDKTQLDSSGTVEFHELGIVALISVNQSKWESKC